MEQKLGKDYKYNEFIYFIHEQLGGGVTDFNTGGFMGYQSKKFYQSDIPYLEAMSLIGRCLCYSTRKEASSGDDLKGVKKDLKGAFKNLKESNFTLDGDSDISKRKIGYLDAYNLWAAWKAGILKPTKNGNLKWTGTITYKQAVQLTMKAIINDSEGAADKSDYTDFVVLSASGNKNNGSNKSEEKKEITLINYN